MAKIGAGLDAQKIQSGEATPTPSDTLNNVLHKTIGSLAEKVNTQGEMDEAVPTVDPKVSGFTADDELLPISERWNPAQSGELNPTFDDWQQSGNQVEGAEQQSFAPRNTPVLSSSPQSQLLERAKRTASMMNPSDNTQGNISFNTHADSAYRDQFLEANRKVGMALDETERDAAKRERYNLVKEMENKENTILQTMSGKLDALTVDPKTNFSYPDPRFLITAQLATENELDMMFLGNNDEAEVIEPTGEDNRPLLSKELINPTEGAERVGRSIGTWWNAEKQGATTADKMTSQENKDLGAQHLLAYAQANPHMVKATRVRTNEKGESDPNGTKTPWRFQLTPEGADILEQNREFRQQALGINIGPENSPKRSGLQGAKEVLRPAYRKRNKIGSDDPSYASLSQFEEAIGNQNGVAHVVDDRRMRIAVAMLFPSLFGKIGDRNDRFGDAFGLGRKSFDTVKKQKQELDGMEEVQALEEAIQITRSKKADAARDMKTLAMYRKSPNYLTFAMQPLTGRMMAQQTEFNPTRKKIVRFVTRSKHPATISNRSGRMYNNYMNIMALSFGADASLEKGRMADLMENKDKYVGWGKLLEDTLNQVFPQNEFEQLSEAVAKGSTVPNMEGKFMQFQQKLAVDPSLLEFIVSKGEDGMMAIDALIDFKNFNEAMDKGQNHVTFINAYIDGKTNGIANQGMMLGNPEIAARVGALRPDDSTEAVGGGDLRDAMVSLIDSRLEEMIPVFNMDEIKGKTELIRDVLRSIGSFREINKTVTMVFPYGKEVAGLKGEIKKHLPELQVSDPTFAGNLEILNDAGITTDKVIDAAHDNVVYALFELFGTDTFNTRGVMRSVGFMHALGDKLFSLRGPSGHRILLGDNRSIGEEAKQSKVRMRSDKADATLILQDSPQYASSAAKKDGESAGYVRGRAAVIPTQSIDAATVVRTATGNSWDKLKESHPAKDPYFFQIYDAYKVDVHGYDTIVDEVNTNFLDITTRDWNFVSEALKEYRALKKDMKTMLDSAPDKEWSLKDGKFDYLYDLMNPEHGQAAKAFIKAADPIDPSPRVKYLDGKILETKSGEAAQEPSARIKGYDEYIKIRTQRFQNALLQAFNVSTTRDKNISASSFMNPNTAPKLITSRQVSKILDTIEGNIKLEERLSKLSSKTNLARGKLRGEIESQFKRTGVGVLQFWAH